MENKIFKNLGISDLIVFEPNRVSESFPIRLYYSGTPKFSESEIYKSSHKSKDSNICELTIPVLKFKSDENDIDNYDVIVLHNANIYTGTTKEKEGTYSIYDGESDISEILDEIKKVHIEACKDEIEELERQIDKLHKRIKSVNEMNEKECISDRINNLNIQVGNHSFRDLSKNDTICILPYKFEKSDEICFYTIGSPSITDIYERMDDEIKLKCCDMCFMARNAEGINSIDNYMKMELQGVDLISSYHRCEKCVYVLCSNIYELDRMFESIKINTINELRYELSKVTQELTDVHKELYYFKHLKY